MTCTRRPYETLLQYKVRRRLESAQEKERLEGELKPNGTSLNRENLRKLIKIAKKELEEARSRGYTDKEILDSLKTGNPMQQNYAKFLEFYVMKEI